MFVLVTEQDRRIDLPTLDMATYMGDKLLPRWGNGCLLMFNTTYSFSPTSAWYTRWLSSNVFSIEAMLTTSEPLLPYSSSLSKRLSYFEPGRGISNGQHICGQYIILVLLLLLDLRAEAPTVGELWVLPLICRRDLAL